MDALHLNPGRYRGTYKLIGGRASLDFVNTISWPETERAHDWLASVGNLRRWLRAVGLSVPRGERVDVGAAAGLRATLDAVLRPLACGQRPTRKAINRLNRLISAVNVRRVIDPEALVWTWLPPKHTVDYLAPVILDAAELLTADNHDRLRACPSCAWLFDDQTRNGRRRWCDMADCGTRDKAYRYYHSAKG